MVVEKTSGTVGKRIQKLLLWQVFSNLLAIAREQNNIVTLRGGVNFQFSPTGMKLIPERAIGTRYRYLFLSTIGFSPNFVVGDLRYLAQY